VNSEFARIIDPHCRTTAARASEHEVILSIGDTTFLDYGSIVEKRSGYGPTGKGGNGLILHSALALSAQTGQPMGLLWQKLWSRDPKIEPPVNETEREKKQRQSQARKQARLRPFEEKESYRWVEAIATVNQHMNRSNTRVVHVFDREGDISEVFEHVQHLSNTGVVVRATHDRKLDGQTESLWAKVEAQPIAYTQILELPATSKRKARRAKVVVRFCAVHLHPPSRFEDPQPLKVNAVYAQEVDAPEGETPLDWMLLTTEAVKCAEDAAKILRWYTYRWHVEEYHKLLKSGTQVERYRLAAEGMKTLIGFLSVIAVELFELTYLHRTQPELPITNVLNPVQVAVLRAKSKEIPETMTVGWAIAVVARLGGYLEHRRNTPVGIQVFWRGWLKLHDLCEGWKLAQQI
jgi:hypothetical protein